MLMNSTPLERENIEQKLMQIKEAVSKWLVKRQIPDKTFGHFQFCRSSIVTSELNAETGALELWIMLGLPISQAERLEAIRHIQTYQNPKTGLCSDPSWKTRHNHKSDEEIIKGDSFFTMTAACALSALGGNFYHSVHYLAQLSPEELIANSEIYLGAHNPLRIGDYASLIRVNMELGVANSREQFKCVCEHLEKIQDQTYGLWGEGQIKAPYTQYVNLAFHLLRNTWNVINKPYPYADKIIDTCLACANDVASYSWETGYACNDLDLAVMMYSASCWSSHRKEEVSMWARQRLPMILDVQKEDGGFSFYHEKAMIDHAGLRMSPGESEGDIWGTLMYMGTIKMMVEIGYPGIKAPWDFSQVHQVPKG